MQPASAAITAGDGRPSLRSILSIVAIMQIRRKNLRYLLLGDVNLVFDPGLGIRLLTDNRVHGTARAERQAADDLSTGLAGAGLPLVPPVVPRRRSACSN